MTHFVQKLLMMTLLVLLSQLKYHVLMMTANFVDLMIVDTDAVTCCGWKNTSEINS